MLVTAILPTYEAYIALTSREEESKKDTIDINKGDNNSLDTLPNPEESGQQDLYKNKWDDQTAEAYVVKEEESLRTKNEKHFRMSDGSYTLMSFADPVHYLNDGKYEEIDNSLVKEGNKYKNKSNLLQVEIPESYAKGGKTYLSVGKYELSFRLENYKLNKPKKIDNKTNKHTIKAKANHNFDLKNESGIYFDSENNDIELEQLLIGTKFKENIIVNNKMSNYEYIFDIKTKGLTLYMDEGGNILATADNKVIMKIPKGFMFDANNVYSDKVEYELTAKSSGYTLKIIADSGFINSPDRVFPVTIDPTVSVTDSSAFYSAARTLQDDFVDYDSNLRLQVSKNNVGFICFEMPKSITNATIINASLNISAALGGGTSSILSIWENGMGFDSNNAPDSIFLEGTLPSGEYITVYNNIFDDPNNTELPNQQLLITNKNMSRFSIDITPNIKRCIEFGDSFKGFAFIGSNANTVYIASELYNISAHLPTAEIRYRNIVGLENYWDYEQYEIGKNNIYINKYSDAMTVVHDDSSVASDLPIALQHVYLSQYKNSQYDVDGVFANTNYGLGWKLNYQQIIRYRNGGNYEYFDADGTMHYLVHSSVLSAKYGHEVAEDEDGLGLKLHYEAGKYRMVDNNKNQSWFDYHGRLYKIEDRNGNVTNIVYGNGSQETVAGIPIKEINDGKGNKLILNYNAGGFLTSVSSKRADGVTAATISYTYDAKNKLVKILNDDSTFTNYEYLESQINGKVTFDLSVIKDESNYALKFISDKTEGGEMGIINPWTNNSMTLNLVKTRSVYRSSGNNTNISWLLIADYVYCNGLTITARPEAGKNYVPFSSYLEWLDNNLQELKDRYPAGTNVSYKILEKLEIAIKNTPKFKESSSLFYKNNFKEKSVYDNCGRLVSSYIDEKDSITTLDFQYENASSAGVNVNSNKLKASTSYNPSIVNNVINGSFENGTSNWSEFSSIGNIYKYSLASQKFSAQGLNSLEMLVSQPTSGEFEVSQYLTVLPGTYTLSAFIKAENILVPNSGTGEYGAFVRMGSFARTEYVTGDIYTTDNGFKKVSVTFTFTSKTSFYIDCVIKNCAGTVYFDGIQIAKNNFGEIDVYNNAINAGFEKWDGILPNNWELWTDTGLATSSLIKKESNFDGLNSVKLIGSEKGSINLYQHVPIPKSNQSSAYTFSAWVNNYG